MICYAFKFYILEDVADVTFDEAVTKTISKYKILWPYISLDFNK